MMCFLLLSCPHGLPHEFLENADNDNDNENGGGGDDDGDGDGGGNYNDDRGQPQTRNLTTTVNRLNFFKTCLKPFFLKKKNKKLFLYCSTRRTCLKISGETGNWYAWFSSNPLGPVLVLLL